MTTTDQEDLLKQRLRWLKEARLINENRHTAFANDYLQCFQNHIIPNEFSALCDIEDEVLNEHIRRIERDLEDLERGEFRIEENDSR